MATPATTLPPLHRHSHVYKVAGGHHLALDVIGARAGVAGPCVVWVHGGGLIFGSRTISPRPSFLQRLLERSIVVVAIDHRLAPETRLPAIVEDVQDAWRWVAEAAHRIGVDPARMGMAGASAGAYLALLGGTLFRPRPRAIASFWGFGDITAPWEAEPSAHYRSMELVTRAAADASLRMPAVAGTPGGDRSTFYLYCRQQGRWLPEVTGHDPRTDGAWFDPYCPTRTIGPGYPPTILVHGEADTDVPASESAGLAAALARAGVDHRLRSLAGVGHGFAQASPAVIDAAENEVADFLSARLGERGST